MGLQAQHRQGMIALLVVSPFMRGLNLFPTKLILLGVTSLKVKTMGDSIPINSPSRPRSRSACS